MEKKVAGIAIAILLVVGVAWFGVTYFEVDADGEFEAPSIDVDVDADAGNVPEFEVKGPDVEVGMEDVNVPVPDVDVGMEETEVSVPSIGIEAPGEEEDIVNE